MGPGSMRMISRARQRDAASDHLYFRNCHFLQLANVILSDSQKKGLLLFALCSFFGTSVSAEVRDGCTRIATAQIADGEVGNNVYTLGPDIDRGLGGPGVDRIQVEFYAAGSGSFALGSGLNSNYSTCAQCLLLIQDVGTENQKNFFADAGTLIIEQSPGEVASLPIELQDVRLIEVTIGDAGSDFISTPVPDGDCVLLDQDYVFADAFENLSG